MTDRPDAKELIEIARATLVAELLPFLPPDKRVTGLMVASAMAIAARELSASLSPVPAVRTADIRGGKHDADKPLYEALLADARTRALISNPKDVEAE